MAAVRLPISEYRSGTRHLSDREFQTAFEDCTLASTAFRHYDHIRLAWIVLGERSLDDAIAWMRAAIARFAMHHLGDTRLYHETLTIAWMRLVAAARRASPQAASFDEFAARHAELLDQSLPYQFYSEAQLKSGTARAEWIDPDVMPLPV